MKKAKALSKSGKTLLLIAVILVMVVSSAIQTVQALRACQSGQGHG